MCKTGTKFVRRSAPYYSSLSRAPDPGEGRTGHRAPAAELRRKTSRAGETPQEDVSTEDPASQNPRGPSPCAATSRGPWPTTSHRMTPSSSTSRKTLYAPENQSKNPFHQSLPRSGSWLHLEDAAKDIAKATEYLEPAGRKGEREDRRRWRPFHELYADQRFNEVRPCTRF